MPPQVDVVIVFRTSSVKTAILSKEQARQNAAKAERQYSALIDTLTKAGLNAVGRRGESQDQLLIMVSCPQKILANLVHCERHSDFLYGLPMSKLPSSATDLDSAPLCSADRIRLVHTYITSTHQDGGLGIIPDCTDWDLVQSVMVLQDHDFNDQWIRLWTTHRIASVQLEKIRDQFGDSVALYFFFLTAYTRALIVPAALGFVFYFFGTPYSTIYSSLLLLWSIGFVEWWRLQERILSVRWCTRGSFKVEKRRADYIPSFPWWKKDSRMVASIPVILLFASVLASVLTGIFVLEAFVTELYKGPGHKLVSFSPTILFMVLVPRLLAMYKDHAKRFTDWENHGHQSAHDSSLTIKVFTLSAINAYLGLALSAFVYVPFGESVMHFVQYHLFSGGHHAAAMLQKLNINLNETVKLGFGGARAENPQSHSAGGFSLWEADTTNARRKLNPSRLQEQMFAFTVTNQAVDTFMEIGLPFILRAVESFRNGKGFRNGNGKGHGKKKRVAFEGDAASQDGKGREEREFLERVRSEVALPEYEVFTDYSEMVTQFGYVALWSTIWPLAPVMALLNNFLEARSDAFKIAVHTRRPIPTRTDTIGPWLESLSFLTWLSALTNSALVYLFRPPDNRDGELGTAMDIGAKDELELHPRHNGLAATKELLVTALCIALVASHAYLLVRALVRHILERAIWKGSKEMKEAERVEREVKEKYLSNLGECPANEDVTSKSELQANKPDDWSTFWEVDEGLEEIQKSIKDA
ncbi:calcium-activated chloride channel-domain-containing protein [Hygrophoropsis aurantiaca]|uniref:Calcium-activated chloride channel-domain-containing protein n=1 Tax=Hygrophoropsis aurantiaca TaxID=72124 RepID=A0ACB8AW71_9AGAM|nr:calcium-activated chloride channel-domain-containing protein [Hygrophoropsis aurantiaca]